MARNHEKVDQCYINGQGKIRFDMTCKACNTKIMCEINDAEKWRDVMKRYRNIQAKSVILI